MSEFKAVEVRRRRDVHRATVRQTAAALARLAGHRQHFPTTAQRRPLQLGHRKVWRIDTRHRQTLKARGGLRDRARRTINARAVEFVTLLLSSRSGRGCTVGETGNRTRGMAIKRSRGG